MQRVKKNKKTNFDGLKDLIKAEQRDFKTFQATMDEVNEVINNLKYIDDVILFMFYLGEQCTSLLVPSKRCLHIAQRVAERFSYFPALTPEIIQSVRTPSGTFVVDWKLVDALISKGYYRMASVLVLCKFPLPSDEIMSGHFARIEKNSDSYTDKEREEIVLFTEALDVRFGLNPPKDSQQHPYLAVDYEEEEQGGEEEEEEEEKKLIK